MPTRRALVAAAIPAIVVFGVFWRWLGFSLPLAAVLGVAWCLASLIVTRSVYDDAEAELAAWRAAAPDLAGSGVPGPARPSAGATPGETSGETPA